MGGGGSSSSAATQYNTYNTTGGSIDFTNLLGNLNYKSGGDISTTNTQSFTQHLSNSAETSQASKGGSGGTFDVAASVGVGVGGNGSGGAVDKQSSYTGDSDSFDGSTGGNNSTGGIPNKWLLIGGSGVALSLVAIIALKRRK